MSYSTYVVEPEERGRTIPTRPSRPKKDYSGKIPDILLDQDFSDGHPNRSEQRAKPLRVGSRTYDFEDFEKLESDYKHGRALAPANRVHRSRSAGNYATPAAQIAQQRDANLLIAPDAKTKVKLSKPVSADSLSPATSQLIKSDKSDKREHRRRERDQIDLHRLDLDGGSADLTSTEDIKTIQEAIPYCAAKLKNAQQTCAKISLQKHTEELARLEFALEDQILRLKTWSVETGIDALEPKNSFTAVNAAYSVNAASCILEDLKECTDELSMACLKIINPRDLKLPELTEDDIMNYDSDSDIPLPPIDSLAVEIWHGIAAVERKVRSLGTLSRSVRESQALDFYQTRKEALDEFKKYFGDEEKIRLYAPEQDRPPAAMLARAREIGTAQSSTRRRSPK